MEPIRLVQSRRLEAASIGLVESILVVDSSDLKVDMEIEGRRRRPKGPRPDLVRLMLLTAIATGLVGLTVVMVGCGEVEQSPPNDQGSKIRRAHALTAKSRKESKQLSDRCRQLRRHARQVNREPAQITSRGVVARFVAVKCQ